MKKNLFCWLIFIPQETGVEKITFMAQNVNEHSNIFIALDVKI